MRRNAFFFLSFVTTPEILIILRAYILLIVLNEMRGHWGFEFMNAHTHKVLPKKKAINRHGNEVEDVR